MEAGQQLLNLARNVPAKFMSATTSTHFLAFVFVVQLVCGILFLLNRFVPLALLMLPRCL
jgi:hypothetical protein